MQKSMMICYNMVLPPFLRAEAQAEQPVAEIFEEQIFLSDLDPDRAGLGASRRAPAIKGATRVGSTR